MTVERLRAIVRPPTGTAERASADWRHAFEELGTDLPSDYVELIETYGTGCFDDFLWVFSPFTANRHLNLGIQLRDRSDALRALRGDEPAPDMVLPFPPDPEMVPYLVYPEPGGLIPWFATDNGDVGFWITKGETSAWSITLMAPHTEEWEECEGSAAGVLADLLAGRRRISFFPEDFPSPTPAFRRVD